MFNVNVNAKQERYCKEIWQYYDTEKNKPVGIGKISYSPKSENIVVTSNYFGITWMKIYLSVEY